MFVHESAAAAAAVTEASGLAGHGADNLTQPL
jgi:hypothetical protein